MKTLRDQLDDEKIVAAIAEAESKGTAEVRVHIEENCPGDVMDRAVQVFANLHMHQTKFRSGTLLYIAYGDQKFAIIGDAGINAKVGPDFWDTEKQQLLGYFKRGEFTEGICRCIEDIGTALTRYFPYDPGDTNELSDDISYGDQ